jgi:hypothetical protein
MVVIDWCHVKLESLFIAVYVKAVKNGSIASFIFIEMFTQFFWNVFWIF